MPTTRHEELPWLQHYCMQNGTQRVTEQAVYTICRCEKGQHQGHLNIWYCQEGKQCLCIRGSQTILKCGQRAQVEQIILCADNSSTSVLGGQCCAGIAVATRRWLRPVVRFIGLQDMILTKGRNLENCTTVRWWPKDFIFVGHIPSKISCLQRPIVRVRENP